MSKFLLSRWWKSNTVSLHSIKNTGEASMRTLAVRISRVSNFHNLQFKTPFYVGNVHVVWLHSKQGDATLVECKESWLFLVLSIKQLHVDFGSQSWHHQESRCFFPFRFEWTWLSEFDKKKFQKLRVGKIIFIICHTRHSTHSQLLLFPWLSSEVGRLIIIYGKEKHFRGNK